MQAMTWVLVFLLIQLHHLIYQSKIRWLDVVLFFLKEWRNVDFIVVERRV